MSYYEEDADRLRYSIGSGLDSSRQPYNDLALAKLETKLEQQRGSQHLSLGDYFIGDEGCDSLAHFLRDSQQIVSIDLRGNNISAKGLSILVQSFRGLSSLKSLSLEWNNLRSGTSHLLDAFAYSNSLKNLDLRNNRIDAEGAEHIARLIELNKSITTIDLRWNDIGLKGGNAILRVLQKAHSLQNIQLSGNNIPEDALQQIDRILRGGAEESYSPRQFRPQSPPVRSSPIRSPILHQSDEMVPAAIFNKEKSYTDEIQAKYEAQIVSTNRSEQRLNELEMIMEQEQRRAQEQKNDLLRELESEKLQRGRVEDALMLAKEENLKREMDHEKTIQDLQYRLNRLTAENSQIHDDLATTKQSLEKIQYSSSDKLRAMEERLVQQQRLYKQLDETSANTHDKMRRDHEDELRELRRDFTIKVDELEDDNHQLRGKADELENEVHGLRNQVAQLKSIHREQLIDTENRVRDEETAKFNNILRSLEQRMKSVEEAREALSKRNQDLQREIVNNDQRSIEQIKNLEKKVNDYADDNSNLQRYLHSANGENENLRMEVSSLQNAIERARQENEDLAQTLNQRKEAHINQLEQMNAEHSAERRKLEQSRDNLSHRLHELEKQLQYMTGDRDKILREHERLSEELKARMNDMIHQTVMHHMNRLSGGPKEADFRYLQNQVKQQWKIKGISGCYISYIKLESNQASQKSD